MINSLSKPLQTDFDTIVIDILSRYSLDNKTVRRFVESVAQQVRDLNSIGRLKEAKASDIKDPKNNTTTNETETTKNKPRFVSRLENYQTAFNKGGLLGIFFEYLKNKQSQSPVGLVPSDQILNKTSNNRDNNSPIAQTVKVEKNNNSIVNNKILENKTSTLERVINNLQKVQETFSRSGLLGVSKNIVNYFKGSGSSQAVPFTTGANSSVINTINNSNINNDKVVATTKGESQAQKQDLLKEEQTVVLGGINDKGADDLEKIILKIFEKMVPEQRGISAATDKINLTETSASSERGSIIELLSDLALGGILGKAAFGAFGKKGVIRAPFRNAKAARLRSERAAIRAAKPPVVATNAPKTVKPPTTPPSVIKTPASASTTGAKSIARTAETTAAKGFGKAAAKRIPILGTLLTGALLASELGNVSDSEEAGEITNEQAQTERGEAIGGAGGGLVGALGGAAAGAAIGSVVPIVGTAIGGIVGGIAGGFGGESLGRKAGGALVASQQTAPSEPVKNEAMTSIYEPKDLSAEELKKWTESTKNAIKPETSQPFFVDKNTKAETANSFSIEKPPTRVTPVTPVTPETIKATSSMPSSVTETHVTNNNVSNKTLEDIAHNTEKTNKTLLSLSESIFKLAKNINTGGQANNTVLVNNGQQTQAYTSTAQIAANNVDSIRLVRQQFLAATT